MQAIEPPLCSHHLGKNQDQYLTLPVYVGELPEQKIICAFKLTDEEIKSLLEDGILYVSQYTFGNLYHPILLSVDKTDVYTPDELEKMEKES